MCFCPSVIVRQQKADSQGLGLLFPQLLYFPQEFSVKAHQFLLCLLLYHPFSFLFLARQSFKLSPKGVTCNFYILYLKYTKNKSAYTIISNSQEGIIHVYGIKLPQNDPFPIGNFFLFPFHIVTSFLNQLYTTIMFLLPCSTENNSDQELKVSTPNDICHASSYRLPEAARDTGHSPLPKTLCPWNLEAPL